MRDAIVETENISFDITCSLGAIGSYADTVVGELEFAFEQYEKYVCREAQEILGCGHITVCPKGTLNTLKDEMINYVEQTKGMAFAYKHVALGHWQRDFNAAYLGTQILRYPTADGNDEFTDLPFSTLMPCRLCTIERFGN